MIAGKHRTKTCLLLLGDIPLPGGEGRLMAIVP